MPDGSSTSRFARFSNRSVVWIACWKSPSPSRLSCGARGEDALQHPLDRQEVADPAGRCERHLRRARRRRASAAAPCVLAASSSPRWPVAALAQPEFASTARSALSSAALAGDEHRRGGRAGGGEARGADGPLGVADEQPEVGVAARLDPAGDAGRAEARRAARSRRRARARARARAPSASGRTARLPRSCSPARLGQPNIRLRFCTACEEVPFQRLSIAENTSTLPVCSSARGEQRGRSWSRATSRTPGGASTTSTNGSSA